jgi:hypothetical protein
MELSDVYQQQIARKQISFSSNVPLPPFERDQNILNLEKTVFDKFKELGALDEPMTNQTKTKQEQVKTFTFEDAIKDLINIKKNS